MNLINDMHLNIKHGMKCFFYLGISIVMQPQQQISWLELEITLACFVLSLPSIFHVLAFSYHCCMRVCVCSFVILFL